MTVEVSVVIPVRNGESFVLDAVDSVCSQSYSNLECIVVDDHSTDDTRSLLESIEDPRIRVLDCQGNGLAAALNTGLNDARGMFIARLDADDVAMPARLELQLRHLRANPKIVLVGSQILRCDHRGQPISTSALPRSNGGILASLKAGRHALAHSSVMFRRTDVRYTSRPAEDWDFFIAMSREGLMENLDVALIRYRFHSRSVNGTALLEHRRDLYRVLAEAEKVAKGGSSDGVELDRFQQMRAYREAAALSLYRKSVFSPEDGWSRVRRIALLGLASMMYPSAAIGRLRRQ